MNQDPLETKRGERHDDVHTKAERIARQVLSAPPLRMAKGGRKTNRKTPSPSDAK